MAPLLSKLRIGEKILLSTGLVGLLFLAVIWQYHASFERALVGYEQLLAVYRGRETYAQGIEDALLRARLAERAFLLARDPARAEEVLGQLDRLRRQADRLGAMDAESGAVAARARALAKDYRRDFEAVVAAWERRGLDHDSGLQGAFRDSVHRLQDLAATLDVDTLYLTLLQIRRSEKDLNLRRDPVYRNKVLGLLDRLGEQTWAASLEPAAKGLLLQELQTYRETFLAYAGNLLGGGQNPEGKGPFRQAAHRIEALLARHYVPNLERNLLQLRRREKDYLLRHDKRYVEMALEAWARIGPQVERSAIPEKIKRRFAVLLEDYRRDFLALVEEDDRIAALLLKMDQSSRQITGLVAETGARASREVERHSAAIRAASRSDARLMLYLVLVASLLGLALAIAIARHIGTRVVRMAGLLDQAAREVPAERIPCTPGARSELDAMAASVNAMADHKAHLVGWWKASMAEADAARVLTRWLDSSASTGGASKEEEIRHAQEALREAGSAREDRLQAFHKQMRREVKTVASSSARLLSGGRGLDLRWEAGRIANAARTLGSILETLLGSLGERTAKRDPAVDTATLLLIETTDIAKIEGMKAERLLRQRFVLQDNALAELVVWRLPKPAHGSTHEYKYRLAFVVDDRCVLRFDNEAGKGDHCHEGDVERPYRFVSLDQLLEDFWKLVDEYNYD